MATKQFLLPDLGEGLTEGEVVRWLVDVGDIVEIDQPVAEVETAKAVVEVPCPFAGVVTALHAEAGAEVEVGQPLLSVDVGAKAPGSAPDEAEIAELVPEPAEASDGSSGNVLVGYGTGGDRTRRRRGAKPASGRPHRQGRPLAKPPVRKLAKDLGVDLNEVMGSGPDGIITRADVEAAAAEPAPAAAEPAPAAAEPAPAAAQPERAPAAPAPAAAEAAPEPVPVGVAAGGDYGTGTARAEEPDEAVERRPLKGVRKAVAAKMTLSRREIPDATTWVDCDATRLEQLRAELNAASPGVRVTALALIMRACVAGLREFPELNAQLDTEREEIVLQGAVHLGFAAQTDAGLVVPVIRNAHRLSTLGIARELERLARGARERTLAPGQLSGGTFTVSNYGSFGVDGGSAVINYPEAAILGVGRIADRPWVVDGQVAVRKVLQLSIAFDHRICDGGEAAGFLRFVADCVESPTTLLANL